MTSTEYPYNANCTTILPDYVPSTEYQLELFVTECFTTDLLYELYYEGDLELSISNNKTTTSTAAKIIGNGLYNSGFEQNMPCIFTVFANRTVPELDMNHYGSVLQADFDL